MATRGGLRFALTQGDTEPAVVVRVWDRDTGVAPAGLAGAAITFQLASGGVLVGGGAASASIDSDDGTGLLTYTWQTADTDTAGDFEGVFKVTAGGRTYSVPKDARIKVHIHPSIANP